MCGNSNHSHGPADGGAVPVDTLEITIAPSGVIKIVTGKMATSHSTVADAIAAFARAAGVTIESSARVVKGMVREQAKQAERVKQ
jgi:hypothetical protein